MAARLIQLSRSPGGLPKLSIESALVSFDGVAEDWQKNRKYHGGRDRAICLYSVELYAWLNKRLGIALMPGAVGENFTTQGIDLDALAAGDRLQVGPCVIELTDVREPCKQLNRLHPQLQKTMLGRSGWVAKVIEPGTVRRGDAVESRIMRLPKQAH